MACTELKQRFDAVRRSMLLLGGDDDEVDSAVAAEWPRSMTNDAWKRLVQSASRAKVDMCVKSWVTGVSASGNGYCGCGE
jgi:hypothetical protein